MEHTICRNKNQTAKFLFLLLILESVLGELVDSNNDRKESLYILAVIPGPVHHDNGLTHLWPKWERGEAILHGAQVAIDEMKTSPRLLSRHKLGIIPIKARLCDPFSVIECVVGNITSKNNKVIAVIGYFCDSLIRFLTPLIEHNKFGMIQISAMSAINTNGNTSPNYHYILPPPGVMAKAVVKLIERLAISRIGVITRGLYHDTHYSKMTEEFLRTVAQTHNMTIEFQLKKLITSQQLSLSKLKSSSARLVIVFLPPSEAINVICQAYVQGFKWPSYTWVYVELDSNEVTSTRTKLCSQKTMISATENVIFLELISLDDSARLSEDSIPAMSDNNDTTSCLNNDSCLQQLDKSSCLNTSNIYAHALYDSVWAIALALNGSMNNQSSKIDYSKEDVEEQLSHVAFQGATGFVNFSKNSAAATQVSVGIFQVNQGDALLIGSYDMSHDQLHLNMGILYGISSGEPEQKYLLYPPYLTVILCTYMGLSLMFTTATLSLFIHYRKTPKVKATSTTLSLCMFVGCYFLMISSLINTIFSSVVITNSGLRFASCWVDTFLNTVGIDLVLATVFAKTLRIYHIFNKFGKISSLWSDKSLFLLILAAVSVKIVLMIIWASLDKNNLVDETISPLQGYPPRYIVVQKCYSHHLIWWVIITFGYSAMLFMPMIYVAIRTRKIKRKEFKDSKKICVLVAILFILMWFGASLWFLFREVGQHIASRVVYSVSFSATAVVCQIFLFIPKITPPTCVTKLEQITDTLRQGIARPFKGYSYTKLGLRNMQ